MANFKVQMMKSDKKTEELPRRGLVNEVCREFLVHEDQALAHRLQNEEYNHHLEHNKERNAQLREDAPKAKEQQLLEDEAAALAQTNYELQLRNQEVQDAAMARDIELRERLRILELEKKDQEYAKQLLEQEKVTIRQQREMRQVEREAAYLGINSGLDNVALLSRSGQQSEDQNNRRPLMLDEESLSDLSDLCIQPSVNMEEEEARSLQENQDEELARLLQEQDVKRRGDRLREDQLNAIEAQDRELAKVLQEQERAKAKKAREKARQKALLKKQQRQQTEAVNSQLDTSHGSISSSERPPEAIQPEMEFPPPRGEEMRGGHSYRSDADLSEYHQPAPDIPPRIQQRSPSGGINSVDILQGTYDSPPIYSPPGGTSSGYTNIACVIDPTYQRRVQQGELTSPTVPSSYNTNSLGHNTSGSSMSSSSSGLPSALSSPVASLPPPLYDSEEDDYPAPPYMPIQGQRRTASLEKSRKPCKLAKEKPKSKDGCKQQ